MALFLSAREMPPTVIFGLYANANRKPEHMLTYAKDRQIRKSNWWHAATDAGAGEATWLEPTSKQTEWREHHTRHGNPAIEDSFAAFFHLAQWKAQQ